MGDDIAVGEQPDVLIINPSSGDGRGPGADAVADAAADLGVLVVELGADDELGNLARKHAASAASIGMAGGDGSLGCVAAEAMRAGIPFVCIPFGTRNHFAMDLGLDREDPLGALQSYTARAERYVDVGMIGDRVFLNNVTFGVYAEVVHSDAYRDGKLSETARVTREMLRGDRAPDRITVVDAAGVSHDAPFALLVANNCYGANLGRSGFGRRDTLTRGTLEVSVVDADSGWDLASLIMSATVGDPTDHDLFVQWTTGALDVETDIPQLRAGLDGEAVVLDAPVRITTAPAALSLMLPAGGVVVERRGLVRALLDPTGAGHATD